jgi:hypothetical protein
MNQRTQEQTLIIIQAELEAIADAMDVPDWAQRELMRISRTIQNSLWRDDVKQKAIEL